LETSNPETRVAVVKAIGNAGVVEFIPDVERIIKDLSQPKFIRVAAVYALKKLTLVTPIVVCKSWCDE
jgi:HEAT repeat protein